MTRSELLDRLTVLMGGRTAEELVFQEISTGAQDDLARATDIARSMVMQYGMSDKLGPQTYEQGHPSLFLDPTLPRPRLEVSEDTCRDIDREVHTLIAEAHERAHKRLAAQRALLDTLAHLLLEKETIEGDELRAMMAPPREEFPPHIACATACIELTLPPSAVGTPTPYRPLLPGGERCQGGTVELFLFTLSPEAGTPIRGCETANPGHSASAERR